MSDTNAIASTLPTSLNEAAAALAQLQQQLKEFFAAIQQGAKDTSAAFNSITSAARSTAASSSAPGDPKAKPATPDEKQPAATAADAKKAGQKQGASLPDFEKEIDDSQKAAHDRYSTAQTSASNMAAAGQIGTQEEFRLKGEAAKQCADKLETCRYEYECLEESMRAKNDTAGAARMADNIAKIKAETVKLDSEVSQGSVFGRMDLSMKKFAATSTDVAAQVSTAMTSAMNSVSTTVSKTITDAIFSTSNWRQKMQQLGQTITQTFVQMVTQYVAAKLAMMAADAVANETSQANAQEGAGIYAVEGVTKAGAEGNIWGLLAYVAVFGAVMAAVMGIVAAASGGMAQGGIVRGPGGGSDDQAGLFRLSNGEAVLPAGVVAQNPGLVQGMIAGAVDLNNMASQIPSAIAAPIGGSAAYAAAGGGFSGNIHVAPAPVQVAVLNSPAHVRSFLTSADGRKVLYDTVRSQMLELGLKS